MSGDIILKETVADLALCFRIFCWQFSSPVNRTFVLFIETVYTWVLVCRLKVFPQKNQEAEVFP